MPSIDYGQHPEVIAICTNCKKKDCKYGTCQKVYKKIQELKGEHYERVKDKPIKRRNAALHEIDGETHTLIDWCELKGINYNTVITRLRRGIPLDEALDTPIDMARSRAVGRID